MRILMTTAFIWIVFQTPTFASNVEDPSLKRVTVTHGDSTVSFSICSSSKQINCRSGVMYHWYEDNRMHKNRGDYAGRLIHGEVHTYDGEGRLRESGRVKYGVKKGKWVCWHNNGEISRITKWRHGKRFGVQKHFNEKGELILKRKFRSDRRVGRDKVYQDGKLVRPEKIPKKKKEKGEKRLKVEKFNKSERNGESQEEKNNRKMYRWFKNIFKQKDTEGKVI